MGSFGDALIVSGLVMLTIVILLGYNLYSTLSNQPPPQATSSGGNATSVNGVLSLLVNNITNNIYSESYIFIKIVLLFLFGSIGYKFASLGINANKEEVIYREVRSSTEKKSS